MWRSLSGDTLSTFSPQEQQSQHTENSKDLLGRAAWPRTFLSAGFYGRESPFYSIGPPGDQAENDQMTEQKEGYLMSATNRGYFRHRLDQYATPQSALDSIFPVFFSLYRGGALLEPSCGAGNVIDYLSRAMPEAGPWLGVEVDKRFAEGWDELAGDQRIIDDFLTVDFGAKRWAFVVGNPPYKEAEAFVRKCFELLEEETGRLLFLLRLNFLGSQKRRQLFADLPLAHVFVLSKRPSFTNGGTDATEYAWFLWDRAHPVGEPARLSVL